MWETNLMKFGNQRNLKNIVGVIFLRLMISKISKRSKNAYLSEGKNVFSDTFNLHS